jgi:hypothetical protein
MESKQIILPTTHKKIVEKPKKKRVVTTTKKWSFSQEILDKEYQNQIVQELRDGQQSDSSNPAKHTTIKQQIMSKIAGYSAQDKEKGWLDTERFVQYTNVLDLFEKSSMKCYYCDEYALILYENVREPKQWTLERLDNSQGHNVDNVVLACLHCNLRRRCMNPDRYRQTQEMRVIVKL